MTACNRPFEDVLSKRHDLLEAILEEPRTKPGLVDALSVSRSTVDRGIETLLEAGYITENGSTFEPTETGRLSFRSCLEYRADLEQIQEGKEVLEAVPLESIQMEFLRGAAVDVADPRAPWTAFEASMKLVQRADSLTGTAPAVFQQFFDDLSKGSERGGLQCELVLDETLFESFGSTERKELKALVESDGGRLLVTEISDPYALWIAASDERVHAGVTVYSDGGLVGVLRNDDPDAVAWVREEYRRRADDADVVWDFTER